MAAIWKLAKDKNKSKSIRKKMRQDFHEKQIKVGDDDDDDSVNVRSDGSSDRSMDYFCFNDVD